MTGPNAEQIKAIRHNGGVLLSAGAGSGKTYVLTEHVIYLVESKVSELQNHSTDDFELEIKKYFSQIVLMTFTKKATGELAIRLKKKFEAKKNEATGLLKDYWSIAFKNLDFLTVTTIHGFCLRLLKQGFFTRAPLNLEIISEDEHSKKITTIVSNYLETYLENLSDAFLKELILKSLDDINQSMIEIFSDASLRLSFKNLQIDEIKKSNLDTILEEGLKLSPEMNLFEDKIDLSRYQEFKDKTWYQLLQKINDLKNIYTIETIKTLVPVFLERLPSKPNKNLELNEVTDYFDKISEFKKFIKEDFVSFIEYETHFESKIKPLLVLIKNLVDVIEKNYFITNGLIFSDLEYIVHQELQNPLAAEKIFNIYKYFIVDEFQDTSLVQFEIISKLVKNDFNRLFCVGDLKQAIYGFRGGELKVFQDLGDLIPKKLDLVSNYRSHPEIINFNNFAFEYLFEKGIGYKGNEQFKVKVDYQTVPTTQKFSHLGKVSKIIVDMPHQVGDNEKIIKFNNDEVNANEANAVVQKIEDLVKSKDSRSIAVLFRKFTPVSFYITELMTKNISFTSQIKVPFSDDPLLSIAVLLIEGIIENKMVDHIDFMINNFLKILDYNQRPLIKIKDEFDLFFNKYKTFGFYAAFFSFINRLGLTTSNSMSSSLLFKLILAKEDDLNGLYHSLKSATSAGYKYEFQFGSNPLQIQLMSAHSSKGLEFDHVFLVGNYTNDRSKNESPMLGTNPGSVKYKIGLNKDDFQITPQFWLEKKIKKAKDFSESKRLFYVASTRAREHLYWVDFQMDEEAFSIGKNSWINGLKVFEQSMDAKHLLTIEHLKTNQEKKCILHAPDKTDTDIPFFHKDNLGIEFKKPTTLLTLSELSVTSISSVTDCPFKFYLKNICKISEEDLQTIKHFKNTDEDNDQKQTEILDEETDFNIFKSSMSRGTHIHQHISESLLHNFSIPRNLTDQKEKIPVEWAIHYLRALKDKYNFISEKPIKFPVFGYMCSGTPDLILIPKNTDDFSHVIDFKTGSMGKGDREGYWAQLQLYSYALWKLKSVSMTNSIKIALFYVDEQKILEKIINYEENEVYIKNLWGQFLKLDYKNTKHCSSCIYSAVCS